MYGFRFTRALALAAVAIATFCTPGYAQESPKRGGTLTMVQPSEPGHLMAAVDSSVIVQQISSKMFNGLINFNKDFDPIPELATSWDVSKDGLSITFHLRDGVKWHDGKPFTSDDVKFSIEEVSKKYHPRGRNTLAKVKTVETPDKLTAIFRLESPIPYLFNVLHLSETPMVPRHVYGTSDPRTIPAGSAPIGTGPFKFTEWKRGNYILLDRFKDYWDTGKPYLDRIVFRIIPDNAARTVAFESGEVDLGGDWPVPLSEFPRLLAQPTLAQTVDGYAGSPSVAFLEFNLRDPQFKDIRVRQAIAHVIDRDGIVNNVYFGYSKPATGPVSPSLKRFYTADVPRYPLDTKKAEQLLDEAGFPRKADGIRFSMVIDPQPSAERFRRVAEYIKQSLAGIGIKVELRTADMASYLKRAYTDRDFQAIFYSISNGIDPTIGVQRQYWSKSIQVGVPFTNGSGYQNPEMDQILEQAQVELDPAKRVDLFNRMQRLVMTDLPNIAVVAEEPATLYNKRVHNVTARAMGNFDNFAEIFVDAAK